MRVSRLTIILFFVLTGMVTVICAQENPVADSLVSLLDESEDERRLEILFQLSDMRSLNQAERIDYARDAVNFAQRLDDTKLLVDAQMKLGYVYFEFDENNDAIESFENAYNTSESLDFDYGMADALIRIGRVNNYTMNTEAAENYFNQALEICTKNKLFDLEGWTLNYLGDIQRTSANYDMAMDYYGRAREAADKAEDHALLASIYSDEGQIHYLKGDFVGSIESYQQASEIYLEAGELYDAGRMYVNMSSSYTRRGEYELALNNLELALPIFEQLNNYGGVNAVKNNIAIIYFHQEMFDESLDVQLDLLESSREADDKKGIADALNNIGNIYNAQAEDSLKSLFGTNFQDSTMAEQSEKYLELFDEALDYYNQAYEVREELDDRREMASVIMNIGIIYIYSGMPAMALEPLEKARVLIEAINDHANQATVYLLLGDVYMAFANYNTALDYLNDALEIALEADVKQIIVKIYEKLAAVHERQGNYTTALDYTKKYFDLFEEINMDDRRQAIAEMQVRYETAATEKENLLLSARTELAETRQKQLRIILFITIFAIGIFIVMMLQLIRQNNLKKRANRELALKNELITEQKKEITDSIQYASRIQTAMLPPGDYVDSLMPERFIIYMPRDIVSGDYYYITEKEGKIICVAADCTGHGVPGAFMSMLGIAFLNEIISKHQELHTDHMLAELRDHVIKSLHQTGKEGESQDGMDLALFILDPNTMKLEFSGANNSLLVYRNGEMIERKADKMPIGIHTRVDEPFTRHIIDLKKGDMVYTFSDGYPDQFGGPNQKKFMIKNFKKMLMEIHQKSMEEQRQIMQDTLANWMAETDQVDDILVIGVRI